MLAGNIVAAALALVAPLVTATGRPMNGWVPAADLGAMPAVHRLTVRLQRQSATALHRAIEQVSTPSSPQYRQYMTPNQIRALVAPVEGAQAAVVQWATAAVPTAAVTASPHGDYLFIDAHPDELEALFRGAIDFVPFVNTASRHARVGSKHHVEDVRALLPATVHAAVQCIFGINEFFPVPTRPVIVHDDASVKGDVRYNGDTITPTILRSHYKVTGVGGQVATNQQGVAAFEDAEFRQADVNSFTARYNLTNVQIDILGPNDGGYYGEAGLDTQYIMSTGEGIKTWFLSQEVFDLLQWSFLVMNMTAPPQVLSISWGSGESSYRPDHMAAASDEFGKMGLQGISIFTASGDDGVGRRSFEKCYDPTWPTVSPYVTSVGGTYLLTDKETAWVSSGGGFSSVFSRPSYQDTAVDAYLNSGAPLPAPAKFSVGGRSTPDVSAIATNYLVDSFNTNGKLTGTSAACPVVAGMVSLINDIRAKQGKGPVGFINPTLYAAHARDGDDFLGYDITAGDNKLGRCVGFPAVPGYDSVTGFGSLNWNNLFNTLMGGQ